MLVVANTHKAKFLSYICSGKTTNDYLKQGIFLFYVLKHVWVVYDQGCWVVCSTLPGGGHGVGSWNQSWRRWGQ